MYILYTNIKMFNSFNNNINGQNIKLVEYANAKKLKWCIDNYDGKLKGKINTHRTNKDGTKADSKKLLIKYYKKLNKDTNVINVEYKQTTYHNTGRYFSLNSLSLQNVVREVRHTIGNEYYYDLDIVNAHPVFLLSYCKKNNIECDVLEDYINNRDEYFKDIKKTFNDEKYLAKQLMLTILNGGGDGEVKKCSSKIKAFRNEIKNIHEEVCNIEKELYEITKNKPTDKPEYNLNGRCTNMLLCDMENKVLFKMVQYLENLNINVGVLVFDGCMIEKTSITKEALQNILIDVEQYVYKELDINIKLKIKDMDEGFEIPPEELENIDMELIDIDEDIEDCIQINEHRNYAIMFKHLYGKNIKIISNEKMTFYHWCEKSLLWVEENHNTMIRFLNVLNPYFENEHTKIEKEMYNLNKEDELYKDKLKPLKEKLRCIKNCLKSLSCTNFLINIIKYYSSFEYDKEFNDKINKSPYEIPIKNGYKINLKDKTIIKRTRNDLFSFELDVKLSSDKNKIEKANNFLKSIMNNNDEMYVYIKRFSGYIMSGDISQREFFIMYGSGCNGKSSYINIIERIMKKYYASISDTVIMKDERRAARATPELISLITARVAVINESNEDEMLNSGRIKSLTGNDTITARGLYEKEVQFKTQSKIILLTNKKPLFDISDKGMTDRLRLIPFENIFQKNKENTDIVNDLLNNYLDEFFTIFIDGAYEYFNEGLSSPKILNDAMRAYYTELDNVILFIDNYNIYSKAYYDSLDVEDQHNIRTKKTDVYNDYIDWCEKEHEKPMSKSNFTKSMLKKVELSPNINGSNTEQYLMKKRT